MLAAGLSYRLVVEQIEARGAWLNAQGEKMLLPSRECPAGLTPGQELEVFLYIDRGNTRRLTTQKPLAQVGEFALLQVQTIAPQGAFLAWGLAKDLLCPFREQQQQMLEKRRYLVRICHDHEGRPIASSRLERFLMKENRDLVVGQQIDLIIWTFTDLGAKVIVNHTYEALLYRDDIPPGLKRGDQITGYVQKIRADGRIDVTLRRPGADGISDAREVILEALERNHGELPLHDQSSPEQIRSQLGLSKKVFKKALGGLYKDGLIKLVERGIERI
ncbi:MAG: hypothetical protein JXQ81_02580 [Desulfuromonadales bacterium]|nr:hypothetical protein [Desulfuromonadales bacterium]MBN2791373.1 hypothetical protein [Desulfuromonadales bacterium]